MTRLTLIKVHMLLASFIFPVAFMFLVTGSFYTWEIKGSYVDSEHEVALGSPLTADLGLLTSVAVSELDRLQIDHPSGQAKVKKAGTSFRFEWTGSKRDVLLEPTDDESIARFTVKETSWYRNFVQLHKAKGGTPFKVYAAVLAASLFLILLSGFVIALQIPKYRKQAVLSASAGFVVFIILVSTS
jgi:hypothetical protein